VTVDFYDSRQKFSFQDHAIAKYNRLQAFVKKTWSFANIFWVFLADKKMPRGMI